MPSGITGCAPTRACCGQPFGFPWFITGDDTATGRRAFLSTLESNISPDPQIARLVRQAWLGDMSMAKRRHQPDKRRRRVPVPFGSHGLSIHPNHLWSTRQVTAPS